MRYTDSLLADGEVIVRRARQHWLALAVDGRRGWILLVIGLLALIVGLFLRDGTDPGQTIGSVLSVVALLALVLGLALVAYHVLAWRAQDYVVTNRRVVQVEGVLNKRAADSSLEKINDAVLTQNVVARILRYGDLEVLTASKSAIDRFHMLARAADFKREMLNQKHALEIEVARPPTPPLRADRQDARVADSRPESPGAAPFAHSAGTLTSPPGEAPAGTAAASEQTMSTLARLADLRDRGSHHARGVRAEEGRAARAALRADLRMLPPSGRGGPRAVRDAEGGGVPLPVAPATMSRSFQAAGGRVNSQLLASLIAVAIILLVGFPVHEFSHALAADRLGDHTARHLGRLSLDPRVHFDPLGGGLLVLSAVVGGIFIGWAKPTPVNPSNLEGGHRGEAMVAAAGPVSNLIMAGLVAIALRVIIAFSLIDPYAGTVQLLVLRILLYLVLINVFLFVFNLLPFPRSTATGSSPRPSSPRTAWQIRQYEQYGFLLIVVVFLLAGPVIGPIGTGIANFLVGQTIF